jgi:hypothetical protein
MSTAHNFYTCGDKEMISHVVNMKVPNATAEQFYDFMINPNSERYNRWMPEEHLQYFVTKHGDKNHLGDEVFFEENLGETRRLAFHAIVITANRPSLIVWQMKKTGLRLPAYLELGFLNSSDGLAIRHELKVGYGTILGKLFDPFFRIYLNKSFLDALEKHCLTEWSELALAMQKPEWCAA